jgi:glutathione S-transferase
MPRYVPIDEAKAMGGLRLVLTAIAGAPWTEAAKAVFHVKRIPYVPVAQIPVETNDALRAWTGHENAPIAVYESEKPRTGWAEILLLAERLAPDPPLIPADPDERVRFFGLAHELCGEDGLAWNRRLQMIEGSRADGGAVPRGLGDYLVARYGYSEAAAARAPARIAEILRTMSRQYRAQAERGRAFLVGDRLSALDLYWATFAAIVDPLPPAQCPMPEWLRDAYRVVEKPSVREALDPGLLEHRDRIYRQYLELPIDT